jgi:hypothetical protein
MLLSKVIFIFRYVIIYMDTRYETCINNGPCFGGNRAVVGARHNAAGREKNLGSFFYAYFSNADNDI